MNDASAFIDEVKRLAKEHGVELVSITVNDSEGCSMHRKAPKKLMERARAKAEAKLAAQRLVDIPGVGKVVLTTGNIK